MGSALQEALCPRQIEKRTEQGLKARSTRDQPQTAMGFGACSEALPWLMKGGKPQRVRARRWYLKFLDIIGLCCQVSKNLMWDPNVPVPRKHVAEGALTLPGLQPLPFTPLQSGWERQRVSPGQVLPAFLGPLYPPVSTPSDLSQIISYVCLSSLECDKIPCFARA